MFTTQNLTDSLRVIASALQAPVIVILLVLVTVTVVMAGTLAAELVTERLRLRVQLPQLINALKRREKPLVELIEASGLLFRQKRALLIVAEQTDLTPAMRESLAAELLFEEKSRYDLRVRITDLVMKLGPMFGLLGTLIPLGPGIIAMGRGDTYTLSASLLTAFDTTIAGLIAAAAATLISAVRKRWYAGYQIQLETVMECLLEAME